MRPLGRVAALASALLALPVAAQDFHILEGHGGPVMDIAVDEEGRVATASFDNAVGLWEDRTPEWRDGHQAAVNVVRFDAAGLASGADDFAVILWDEDGAPTRLGAHRGKVMGLALSEDAVASASWDGTVGLWPRDGSEPVFLQHGAPVNDVAWGPDGRLYTAAADGVLRVWRGTVEEAPLARAGFGINEIEIGPGWIAYGAVDGSTRVLDIGTGETLADLSLGRRPVLALAVSLDAARLAVGDGEGFIMVVDTADWSIVKDFRATQTGPVWALAFSPDGGTIYAGGLDDAVHAWPVATMDDHAPMADVRGFHADPATMENGERQFARKCSICHALTGGTDRKAGPTLAGLFGRRAGTVEGYSYSDALDGSNIIWTEDTVDALFDEGPDVYVPGTKMPVQRIARAQDRADLVTYLKRATREDR